MIWAMTTRMDPMRDTVMIDNTRSIFVDFASPISGLGSKIALDAAHKWPGETTREWGRWLSFRMMRSSSASTRCGSELGID